VKLEILVNYYFVASARLKFGETDTDGRYSISGVVCGFHGDMSSNSRNT